MMNDLFSVFQRALQLAAVIENRKVSTAEGLERSAEAQWSRRRFLQVSSAAAGAALIPQFAPLRMPQVQSGQLPRVVIVGGGTAGLTAAYRLAQAGVPARVLKARQRVGGRLYTLREVFPNQMAELGAEFIGSDDEYSIRLAQELGLTLVDVLANSPEGETVYYFDGRRLTFDEMVEMFQPMAGRMVEDLNTLSGPVTYSQPNNGQTLDQFSVAGWLDSRGVTGVMANIVNAALVGRYGLESDQQSGFNLLTTIDPAAQSFEMQVPYLFQYRIAEGADSLPARLMDNLLQDPEPDSRLEAISQRSDGVYVLTVNQGGAVIDIEADDVVLAMPFSTLRNVDIQFELPAAKRQAIDTLGYGSLNFLLTGFREKIWQQAGGSGTVISDLGLQWAWDSSRGQPGEYGIIKHSAGGNQTLTLDPMALDEQANWFVSSFDQVFPGAAASFTGARAGISWGADEFALGGRSTYLAGQMTTIRGAEGESVGGLHFAGEHAGTGLQARIEGAVESGERAALNILTRAGMA
jgi:monoamine oxidase